MRNIEFEKLERRLKKQGWFYDSYESTENHKRFIKIILDKDYYIYYEYLPLEKVWFPII